MFEIDFIARPLGYIIKLIYSVVPNYGIAIIIFTIFIKLILLPLSIKSQKSMVATQKIQPLLQQLQQKYKNDKEKLNQETMKLYSEHKVNPLGGCLPLLIQLPILIALIQVIYAPCKNILMLPNIDELLAQYSIAKTGLYEIQLASELYLSGNGGINFSFCGIDLANSPNYMQPSVLWIIPLLATIATFLSGKLTTKLTPQNNANAQGAQMAETMTTLMPLMTLWITFTMPVGAGLYWLISTLTQMLQQWGLTLYFRKKTPDVVVVEPIVKGGKKK